MVLRAGWGPSPSPIMGHSGAPRLYMLLMTILCDPTGGVQPRLCVTVCRRHSAKVVSDCLQEALSQGCDCLICKRH